MTEMNGSLTEGLKELNIEYNDEKLEKIVVKLESESLDLESTLKAFMREIPPPFLP